MNRPIIWTGYLHKGGDGRVSLHKVVTGTHGEVGRALANMSTGSICKVRKGRYMVALARKGH